MLCLFCWDNFPSQTSPFGALRLSRATRQWSPQKRINFICFLEIFWQKLIEHAWEELSQLPKMFMIINFWLSYWSTWPPLKATAQNSTIYLLSGNSRDWNFTFLTYGAHFHFPLCVMKTKRKGASYFFPIFRIIILPWVESNHSALQSKGRKFQKVVSSKQKFSNIVICLSINRY